MYSEALVKHARDLLRTWSFKNHTPDLYHVPCVTFLAVFYVELVIERVKGKHLRMTVLLDILVVCIDAGIGPLFFAIF